MPVPGGFLPSARGLWSLVDGFFCKNGIISAFFACFRFNKLDYSAKMLYFAPVLDTVS